MGEKTMLEKVSEEAMCFMRGKHLLDEVGNGKDELKFRRGGKTVLTIYIHDDKFEFSVMSGGSLRLASGFRAITCMLAEGCCGCQYPRVLQCSA